MNNISTQHHPAGKQTSPLIGARTMNPIRSPYTRRQSARVDPKPVLMEDGTMASDIDTMVLEGRQRDLAKYFEGYDKVPERVLDWEIRTNVRKLDGVATGRSITAIPLTVRARNIFKAGCLATLRNAGYTEDEAQRYYQYAWRRKYVWVDAVIASVKEMIDAFQNDSVLLSYDQAGDPRRLAHSIMVPKNPYLTSHAHFLVAVGMARSIVRSRMAYPTEGDHPVDPPQDNEVSTPQMVAA